MRQFEKQIPFFLTKILTLLFFIILSGCSSEIDKTENSNLKTKNFIILHKNYNFLKSNVLLFNKLSGLGAERITSKSKNIKTSYFEIFIDKVTYTKRLDNSRESYTFYIEKYNHASNKTIDNLILTKNLNDKDFKTYIITYYFPDGIASKHKNFKIIAFKEINNKTFSINNLTSKSTCENTYEYVVIETAHTCYSGTHSGASQAGSCDGQGSLPYSTYHIVAYLIDGCGGTGGGSNPEGSSGPGGGGGTGSSGNGPSVDTGMSIPPPCQSSDCDEQILANDINDLLGNTLNYEQLQFLFNNNEIAEEVKTFLETNHTTEAKDLAIQYINLKNLKVCLSSFQFSDVGNNWQNAGVAEVNIQFLTIGGIIAFNNIYFSQLHFGLPKSRTNGEYFTNNNAKYIAQTVMTQAEVLTNTYQSINPTSTASQLRTFFYTKLNEGMSEYGGTISTSPPIGWDGQIKQHQTYFLSSGIECD